MSSTPSPTRQDGSSKLALADGSRVGVIGGGPAGSFFAYFLMDMAERIGLDVTVDIYEPKDFSIPGPKGCNNCGGIISESLVQNLATEGINLPPTIVQRGIDSYVLHMDVGTVRIDTPLEEKRIGAVYRGAGPKGSEGLRWGSFDGHLQSLTKEKGAKVIHERVTEVTWEDGRPRVGTGSTAESYDLLAVSLGVNSPALKLFESLEIDYKAPSATKTFIREYHVGEEEIRKSVGSSMHVFLLDIPRLEFAALIPKGEHVSLCMLGERIDRDLIQAFLGAREVRQCLPSDFNWERGDCQCSPKISVRGALRPYADRMVFIGDSGVTRLYKDGIGAAYRTAKSAATTAVFQGISAEDFKRHFWPTCKNIDADNKIGKVVFTITRLIQKTRFSRRGILRMVETEQQMDPTRRSMSTVLWDTFTGSAPYREIFLRALKPLFLFRLVWNNIVAIVGRRAGGGAVEDSGGQRADSSNRGSYEV
jgi:flavin-dependent dehydrogenase